MLPYIVENALKIIPLLFALIAAVGFAAEIVAGFAGIQLPEQVSSNLWSVIQFSLGGVAAGGAGALSQTRAARTIVVNAKNMGANTKHPPIPGVKFWLFGVVLFLLLAGSSLALPSVSFADAPAPLNWQYAAVKCMGVPLATVQAGYQAYATQRGYELGLPEGNTPQAKWLWELHYPSMVNDFVRQFGCGPLLNADGTALTYWAKLYERPYRLLLRNIPE